MPRIALIALLSLSAACEIGHSILREVPASASDPCIEAAVRAVPEITEVRVFQASNQRMVFYWLARRGEDRAQGWVTKEASGLVLETGHTNGQPCAGIAYGKTVLDDIFERLRHFCPGLPDAAAVRETCSFATCDCASDRRLR